MSVEKKDITGKRFPVLHQGGPNYLAALKAAECPRSVPWAFVAEHAVQCERNHGQSVERLAERGGLGPSEMVAVVTDQPWRSMSPEEETSRLIELLVKWSAEGDDDEDARWSDRMETAGSR